MRSLRVSPFISTMLLAAAALGLYLVKYQVQSVRNEVMAIERNLAAEREALALLQAEWAFLNRPERLETLATQYLKITTPDSRMVMEWQDVPMRAQELAAQQMVATPTSGGR
jgi:cell division protein FtsL